MLVVVMIRRGGRTRNAGRHRSLLDRLMVA